MTHSAHIRVMGAHQAVSGAWGTPRSGEGLQRAYLRRYGLDFVVSGVMRRRRAPTDWPQRRSLLAVASPAVPPLISATAFQRQGSPPAELLAKDLQTFPTALHELLARPLLMQDR